MGTGRCGNVERHAKQINIALVRCVLVLRCGLALVVWYPYAGCEALVPQPAYGYHTTTAKPQRNTNTHRTRAIQPMK